MNYSNKRADRDTTDYAILVESSFAAGNFDRVSWDFLRMVDPVTALFLSYLIGQSKRFGAVAKNGGWFGRSVRQIWKDINYDKRQQRTAITRLTSDLLGGKPWLEVRQEEGTNHRQFRLCYAALWGAIRKAKETHDDFPDDGPDDGEKPVNSGKPITKPTVKKAPNKAQKAVNSGSEGGVHFCTQGGYIFVPPI